MMETALTRKEAEWLIESLLAALNDLDGDPDLEDGGDAAVDDSGCDDPQEDDEDTHDREEVCEDEGGEHDGREPEDEGGDGAVEDDEPSLGWTTSGAMGGDSDREADAGDEPESENEA
jgi:hypothetical protein